MGFFKNLWRKISNTKALEQSSGKLETLFFESLYRVIYITGLSTSERDVLYLLYSNAVKLSIVLLVCGELWSVFTENLTFDEIASIIGGIGIHFITLYRYKNMMNNRELYNKLATSMESPYFDISTEGRKKLVEFWSRTSERYLKIVLALGNITILVWYIYPLVDEIEYNLMIVIRLPFYYKTPVLYPVACGIVMVLTGYMTYVVMVTDLMMQTHLLHLLCQYTVLGDCFENLLNDCKVGFEDVDENNLIYNKSFADKLTKRLGDLVNQHKAILSYIMDMRNTLSGPMLGQLATSGILMCFVGYQAIITIDESITKCLMSFLFLGYNVFQLFIICRWCEEITTQSLKLGEAIYCSGWECGLAKLPGVRATIMFVIERANKPMYLTAGGMYNLSLTSYTTLVKTSYSALTVLLQFRG